MLYGRAAGPQHCTLIGLVESQVSTTGNQSLLLLCLFTHSIWAHEQFHTPRGPADNHLFLEPISISAKIFAATTETNSDRLKQGKKSCEERRGFVCVINWKEPEVARRTEE